MRTLALITSFAVLLVSCSRQHVQPRQDVGAECDRLYHAYVEGGQVEARRSLQEVIRLIEGASLSPDATAHGLWMGYGRLFVLEKRTGSNDVAQVALVKARYWCLRKAELSGDSPSEARTYVEQFASEDGLVAFVDKWDKGQTGGRGARYALQQ